MAEAAAADGSGGPSTSMHPPHPHHLWRSAIEASLDIPECAASLAGAIEALLDACSKGVLQPQPLGEGRPSVSGGGVGGRASGMGRLSRFSLEGPAARGHNLFDHVQSSSDGEEEEEEEEVVEEEEDDDDGGLRDKTPCRDTENISLHLSPSEGTRSPRSSLPKPPSPLKRAVTGPAALGSPTPSAAAAAEPAEPAEPAATPSYPKPSLASPQGVAGGSGCLLRRRNLLRRPPSP